MNFLNQLIELSLPEQILLGSLTLAVLVHLFYYFFFYLRVPGFKNKNISSQAPPVSIIICARNEEENLRRLIPEIMAQDYPTFEIVVVNDQSWDTSQETLSSFKITYPNIHVIELRENQIQMEGKKFALALGIKGAKYDELLLTDADCYPDSNNWVKKMMQAKGSDVTLGYSPYQKKKGLLNAIIRFDTMYVAMQYLSFARAGLPYMGVGRNLAYKKELFFNKGGFKKHAHIASGDDDLFINSVANKKNTAIVIDKESFVYSIPKTTWGEWFYQKKRHLTTAPFYKAKHKILLSLYPIFYTVFMVSSIALLILHTIPLLVISLIALRFIVQLVTFILSGNRLGESNLAWWSPLLELVIMTLNPMIYISNIIFKPKEWS